MSSQNQRHKNPAAADAPPLPAVAVFPPNGTVSSTATNRTTQQQFQQPSKRSVLFERASPSWWTVRFDSDILERQHWRSLYSHSKRRFRAALAYVLLASLAWLIYFVALQPGAAWLPFAAGCLLVGLTSLAVLVMSYMRVFLRHAWWLPTWYAILLCCTTALMVVFRNDNLSPITVFCTFLNVLLLLYTVFPLSLGTCAGIGIVFTCVIAVLNIIFHDEHLDEHTFVLPTLLKLILMLLVHVVGVALYVSSQARLRSTFLKVAQSILAKHELGQEKTFVERMIHSVMPPNVAQQIMAGQLQDRRLSSNASVLHLHPSHDDDDDAQPTKKQKKKSKYHSRRSRGSSCVSSSAAKAAAAMFADPVSQVGGGSPTYGGGGHGGAAGGAGGGARGAAGPSIFRPYHMTVMENVSILFADVVGFTAMSSNKTAEQLVNLLNDLFGRFDMLCPKYSCEKISILGDCYYCVSGCPVPRADHAVNCVEMGLGMIDAIGDFCRARGERVQMRVGVHTGSVLAGIVGHKRFKFDVFSNDVTLANKMESTGQPGKVHISEKTYEALLPEQRQLFVMEDGPRVDTVNTMFVLRKRTVASNKRRYPASAPALDQLEQQQQQGMQQPPVLGGYHATHANSTIEAECADPTATAEEERPKSGRKQRNADSSEKKSSNHSSVDRDNSSKTRLTPPRQTMPSFQKPCSRTHKTSTSDSTNRAPIDASSSSLNSAGSSNENNESKSAVSSASAVAQKQKQPLREQLSSHERAGSFKREGSFKANRRPSLRSQLMEAQLVQNATKILATDVSTLSTSELISRRTSKSMSQSPPPTITPAMTHFFSTSGSNSTNSTAALGTRRDAELANENDGSSSSNDNKTTNSSQTKASHHIHAELRPSPSRSEGTTTHDSAKATAAAIAAAAAAGLASPGSPGGSRLERKRTSLRGNYSWPGHEEVTIPPPTDDDDDGEMLTPQQQQDVKRQAEYAAAVAAAQHRGSTDGAAAGNSSSRRGSRKSGSPLTANDAAAVALSTVGGDKSSSRNARQNLTTDFRPHLQPMQSISPYNASTPTDLESQQYARTAAAIGNMPGLQRQYDVLAAGAAGVNANHQQQTLESGGVDATGRRASPMRGGAGGGGKSAMTAMYEMRRDSVFAGNVNYNDADDDDDNVDGGRDSADGLGPNSADSDADDPRDAPRIRYDKLLSRLMKVHKREGEDYFSNPPLHSISLNFLDDDLEHAYRHNFAGRHVGTWTDAANNDRMNAAIDGDPDGGESQRLWQHEHHYYYDNNNSAANNTDNSTSYAMTAMDNTTKTHENGELHPPANNGSDERSPSTSTSIYCGGDNVRTFSSNKFNTFIDLLVASVLLSVIIGVCVVVASAAYLSLPFLIIMPIAIALQVFVMLPSAYLMYQPTLTDTRKQSAVTISMDELGGGAENDAAENVVVETAQTDEKNALKQQQQQLRRERAERRRRRSSNFLQRLSKYFYWNQTWYARHAVGAVLMLLPCAVVWSTFNCEQLCKLMEPCDANIFFCLALFTAFLNFCNFAQLSSWLRTGLAAVVCFVFVMMVSFNICSTFGSSGSSGTNLSGKLNAAASTMSPTIWTLPSRFNSSNRRLAAAARRQNTENAAAAAAAALSSSDYNDFTTLRDNDYDISSPDSIEAVQKFVPVQQDSVKTRVKRFLFDAANTVFPVSSSERLDELLLNTVKSTTRADDKSVFSAAFAVDTEHEDTDYDADYDDNSGENGKTTDAVVRHAMHATTATGEHMKKRGGAQSVRTAAAAAAAVDDYDFVSRTSAPVHNEQKVIYDEKFSTATSSAITIRRAVADRSSTNDDISLAMNIKHVFTHSNNNNNDAGDNNRLGNTSTIRTAKNNNNVAYTHSPLFASYVGADAVQNVEQHARIQDKSISLNRKWLVPVVVASDAAAAAATEAALHATTSARDDKDKNPETQWAGQLVIHAQSMLPPATAERSFFRPRRKGLAHTLLNITSNRATVAERDDSDDSSGRRPSIMLNDKASNATPNEFVIQQTTLKKTGAENESDDGRDFVSSNTTASHSNKITAAKSSVSARSNGTVRSRTAADELPSQKTENSRIENNFFRRSNQSVSLLRRTVRQTVDAEKSADVTHVNADNNCLRYFADIIMIDERTLREGRGIVDQEAWYWRLFHHASPVQYEAIFDALLLLILISFLNRESEIIYRLSFHADSLATRDRETILEMKTQADLLLHNIIPQPVVAKLKETNGQYSENMSNAAIIFASVTNFSGLYAEDYAHGREFLRFLNELIGDFDSLLDKPEFKPYVHKIKTIGATYMAAAFPATALANKPSPAPGAGGGGSSSGGASLGVGGKRTSQAISIAGGAAQYRSQLSQQQQPRSSMPGGAGGGDAVPIARVFPSADATRSVNAISMSSPSRTTTQQRPGSGTAKSPLQSPVRSPSLMFGEAGGGATPKRGSGDAGGVDESRLHQYALMDFAIALQDTVREFNKDMLQYEFKIRIGYNIGEVTAGVLGTQKMYFDIWGDAVNLASRMDSTGVNGEIQVEEGCMNQLQDMYEFRPREGGVYVKGKGEMKTDFLVRKRPKRLPKAVVQATTSTTAASATTKSAIENVPGSSSNSNFTITNL